MPTWVSPRLLAFVQCILFSSVAYGYHDTSGDLLMRQINVSELSGAYDYIVVGGGQSGLVIATRLSEDPTKTVLVVEYGYFDDNPAQLDPSSSANFPAKDLFNVTTVPQPGIGGRLGAVHAAAVVGGGSTVNGMLFDRGSADDYDNWEKMGNPGWGFNSLLPYFKKTATFTPPRADLAAEFNITWDIASAWGNGPIQATFPDWQWPTIKSQWAAWKELGVPIQKEGAAGDAFGAFWVPNNVDQTYRRSYARNAFFDPASSRPNLKLLTGYRVNEVLFSDNKRANGITMQARGTPNGAAITTVKAIQEVILCAGWLHTPQILQRSGLGPKSLLTQAGIPVLVDLPGVGSNLQDHPAIVVTFVYQTDDHPNLASLTNNATFKAWANEQWMSRKGPLSFGIGNALATLPLPIISSTYKTTIEKAQAQSAATYLPKTYGAENVKGFLAQRALILQSYGKNDSGVIEILFLGNASVPLSLEKALSRGTVLLNTTDRYAEPIIDFNTNINPVDSDIFVATIKFMRKWFQTTSMQHLTPVEQSPGTNVSTDAQIASWLVDNTFSSTAHSLGTAAMAPRALAGVVSPSLTVYGVTGLSVGDISIIPMIPATHTCATVYAISEKAADLIKDRYDPTILPASN
ncbi:GMC oxidoreductase [Hypholoma sublateritium FD-334 SS-4]|uniref:pyranose dehydrogenase (acceptor) n=1 Tax=Hypholoma sublateritium (strain FD-334 SS-4) TaxID=945553 RepID=A0A0D2PXT7_HYPSF|nr:GMC oxidoreductase [Hypholoma sublateritium FD-334 SS-4]